MGGPAATSGGSIRSAQDREKVTKKQTPSVNHTQHSHDTHDPPLHHQPRFIVSLRGSQYDTGNYELGLPQPLQQILRGISIGRPDLRTSKSFTGQLMESGVKNHQMTRTQLPPTPTHSLLGIFNDALSTTLVKEPKHQNRG
jgi:hypothetical protein